MLLFKQIKKYGGMQLVKQYWKSGGFFTSIIQLMLLGKSRTALELIRLSASLKTKQKLEKKYIKQLKNFDENLTQLEHLTSNKVWICWFQGMESAPEIVKKCYQSVLKNLPDKEVILITSKNINEYVDFPDYILEKWKKGIITNTHMTDLLRLELLIKYGGLWIDATVFLSGCNIPQYIYDSELFFPQCLKPGRDGHSRISSSWFIYAKTNNKILMAVRELCYCFWKDNNFMWDYFLFHDFMAIVLNYYSHDWNNIIPFDNATPHILLLRLFDEYDENLYRSIIEQTPFHKLTYKFDSEKTSIKNTYYDVLFNDNKEK